MIRAILFQNIIIILLRLIPTVVVYDQSYPIPEYYYNIIKVDTYSSCVCIRAIPFQNIIIILLRLIPTEVVYDQSYPIPEYYYYIIKVDTYRGCI